MAAEEALADLFHVDGQVELVLDHQRDRDLVSRDNDALDLLQLELQLGVLFDPSDYLDVNFEAKFVQRETLRDQADQDPQKTELVIEQAYVALTEPSLGLALQVGRQLFEDDRQWLYDAELDGIRGFYQTSDLSLELSASRRALVTEDLFNESTEDAASNYIAYGAYRLDEKVSLGAYAIVSDDRDEDDDLIGFLGFSSMGTIDDRFSYWFDAAHVRGRDAGVEVRGFGFDLLTRYEFDAVLSPSILFGFAFGSGDADPDKRGDGGFRQTGLQGNEVELGGLVPVRYYGETFDPELSNMTILTLGLGVKPLESLSTELIYHYYRQDEAVAELRNAELDASPTGRSRDLGSEIDLALGYQALEDLQIRGYLGYFMPGRAFRSGADDAFSARIEIEYQF